MSVTPLSQIGHRMPEAGRIRFGVKGPKGQPVALDKFRFTSESRSIIEKLAALYSGEPKVWNPGRGRSEWEVVTDAQEINVVIPPNALGGTPIYELWSGGGVQRRCDGDTLMIPTNTPDGTVVQEAPCICSAKKQMECKPITRLSVMLPDLPFHGTWRLEAKGWNAAHELPGMVEMIVSLADRGLTVALLALEKRTVTTGGQTRHFVVPVLRIPATLQQLAAGQAGLAGLSPAGSSPAAIEAGQDRESYSDTQDRDSYVPDDGIADAEIVDDSKAKRMRFVRLSIDAELSRPDIEALLFGVSDGRADALDDCTPEQLDKLLELVEQISSGAVYIDGMRGRRPILKRKAG